MRNENERPTMRDLAAMADVNQSTISRALRNDPRIPESTRKRIHRLAKKAGFRPDPVLAALSTYKTRKRQNSGRGTIAILYIKGARSKHRVALELKIEGARARAEELGYSSEIFMMDPEPDGQRRLSRMLHNRGIRGLIVCPIPQGFHTLDHIDWQHFAAVAIGTSLESPRLHSVRLDQRCDALYWKLKELGYTRIGYCSSQPTENNYRYEKLAQYLKCLYLDGIPYDRSPPLLYPTNSGRLNPLPWITAHGFDAVMAGDASMLIERLLGTPYAVPDGLAVASLSISLDKALRDRVTGNIENSGLAGAAAVDLLHQNLCHGQLGVPGHCQAIMVESIWNPGATAPRVS